MKTRRLGADLTVSTIGLGCMGMSFAYGGQQEGASVQTLRRAVDIGVTFFDTAEVYGPFDNEMLVGKALREVRDQVVIATKFGFEIADEGVGVERMVGVDGRPENARAVAEASLKRLGVDHIDLYYQHRVDPDVPIEETVGAMSDLVREGKVRALGLSEASAQTIRRAHAVHPLAAVQSEYSLWSRDPAAEVLPACRELGIGFVPYSPLGRGFLTGAMRNRKRLDDTDFRRTLPRFEEANLEANLALVDKLVQVAKEKEVSAGQLSLAWLLHQADDIVPIPGARRIEHLEENAAAAEVTLSADELEAIETAMPQMSVAGARYPAEQMGLLNG